MQPRLTVKEFTNPSGAIAFRVDGKDKDGKRVRLNFKTYQEALASKQELEAAILNMEVTPLRSTRLSIEQLMEAERAFGELKGGTLIQAVRFFVENYQQPLVRKLVADAYADFILAKKQQNLRDDSVRNLKGRVGRFAKAFADKAVSDILTETIEQHVMRDGLSAKSMNNERAALSSFFSWCIKKRYTTVNPCKDAQRIKEEDADPQILSPAMVQDLLNAASTLKDGRMVPYVVLSLFCGLRPRELSRLNWSNISLPQKLIRIESSIAKKRSRRVVEISANAAKWLAPYQKKSGSVQLANHRKNFDAVKKAAGFRVWRMDDKEAKGRPEWVADALRHTAISMHLSKSGSDEATALWAGNSPDVIHEHYKGLTSKADAKAFWALVPTASTARILKMPKAA